MTLQSQIDKLVDGELTETDRAALLCRLDAEPQAWRQCAMAFLEAQSWRASFQELSTAVPVRRPRSRPALWLSRAALLLAAFGLGWMVRAPRTNEVPIAAVPKPVPPIVAPQAPAPTLAQTAPPAPAPVNYVRGLMEREGYRIEETSGFVPGRTRDGRPVAIPVQRRQVRFVGNRPV
jgi:hypothetical protein